MNKYLYHTHSILLLLSLLVLLALAACKPKRPAGILSPHQMEGLLVDYHLAQGMADAGSDGRSMEELRYIYIHAALKKHHIDEAVFDSSLVYYSANSEQLAVICQRVCTRLEAMSGTASTNSSGNESERKYAHLTAQGDTANVWMGMQHGTLMPDVLHNLLVFHWQADSTTRHGDSFIWHCNTQKIASGEMPEVNIQMIMRYEHDTLTARTSRIFGNQEVEVRYDPTPPLDTMRLKSVTTMVYMSSPVQKGDAAQVRNNPQVMLLRDISLVRIHAQEEHKEPAQAPAQTTEDTLSVDTAIRQPRTPETQPMRLSPTELRDAHPHAATINVQKEKSTHTFAPRRIRQTSGNRKR